MKLFAVLFALLFSLTAFASDEDDIQRCLKNWGKHPFAKEHPDFRIITGKVRVMGIGSNVEDTNPTDKPELVLIKPTVSVMSKTSLDLMNPNGWYCLKTKVDVMGKTEINLNCKAHMAMSKDGTTVMGSNKEEQGVTVLGKSVVNRRCGGDSEKKEAKAESKNE